MNNFAKEFEEFSVFTKKIDCESEMDEGAQTSSDYLKQYIRSKTPDGKSSNNPFFSPCGHCIYLWSKSVLESNYEQPSMDVDFKLEQTRVERLLF